MSVPAKPPMNDDYQMGYWEAVKACDFYACRVARDLLVEEAKARGDLPLVLEWARQRGIAIDPEGK